MLFFGCRHRNEDYIYQEELEGYREGGVLSDLQVAFSRDQPEKVYVQHLLKKSGAVIWALLEKQGYFYICGYVLLLLCVINLQLNKHLCKGGLYLEVNIVH